MLAAVEQLMDRHGGPARDEDPSARCRRPSRADLPTAAAAVLDDVVRRPRRVAQTDRALSGRVDLRLLPAMTDMQAQVARLVGPGFVADVGADRLRTFPATCARPRPGRERAGGSAPDRDRR